MAEVVLKNVCKNFGKVVILRNLSFECQDGECLCLLGPSGTGKSMTIKLIAGIEPLTSGQIFIGDRLVNEFEPRERDVAVTFQSFALYSHMSVFDNLAFPLRAPIRTNRLTQLEIREKVNEVAGLLNIGDLLERHPAQLSGGQRQRVALGRMMIRRPSVFLMDEPIAHLDAKFRHYMRGKLKEVQQELGITTIYATPDQLEAMTIAGRIAVLNWGGKIEQIGSPYDLINDPRNKFVATLVGDPSINILEGEIFSENGKIILRSEDFSLHLPDTVSGKVTRRETADSRVEIGIRPNHITVAKTGTGSEAIFRGEVFLFEYAGRYAIVLVKVGKTTMLKIKTDDPDQRFSIGDQVDLFFDYNRLFIFDSQTGGRVL
jgi:multiple sugar transport system ATP-binding protein